MRIGIAGWSLSKFAGKDEFKIVDYALKFGYTDIDLSLEGHNFDFVKASNKRNKNHYTKLYEYAKEKGIRFNQVHASFVSFPNYLLDSYFNKIVKTIKCASYLHCPYMVMHPQVFPVSDVDYSEKELQFNVEFYKKLIPYLKRYNVKLCLENIYDWIKIDGVNTIRTVYVSKPENLRNLVEKIDSDFVGICLDTGHMHLASHNMYDAIEVFGDKLWVLHIHDCYGIKDDHFLMYDGNINWNDVRNGLKNIDYKGVFSLEIKPISDEEEYYIKGYNDAVRLVGDL